VREKKLKIGGVQIAVRAGDELTERVARSALYRHLVGPLRRVVRRRDRLERTPHQPPSPPSAGPRDFEDAEAAAIWDRVSKLGWYHTIELGHGVVTPGFVDNRSSVGLFGLPSDLSGKRCLDIGTYDGFWAFEMERRGASEVIGIDVDSPMDYDLPRLVKNRLAGEADEKQTVEDVVNAQLASFGMQLPGAGFQLAKEILGSKVERLRLNVYDVSPETVGMFDVVLTSQLLVRLRDPQTVIENMFSVAREIAVIAEGYDQDLEMLPRPVSEFVGTEKVGAWWGHSIKSMRKMMEVAGFSPIDEVARFRVVNKAGSFPKVVLRGHVPRVDTKVSRERLGQV
jgi:tRNA (mo5U34)-methyltransferase